MRWLLSTTTLRLAIGLPFVTILSNALTPRDAGTMTTNVFIQGGATFTPTGPSYSIQQVFGKLTDYPRDSLTQRVVQVNMTGPTSIGQQSYMGHVFDDFNSIELEWQTPLGGNCNFELQAVVETTKRWIPICHVVPFPPTFTRFIHYHPDTGHEEEIHPSFLKEAQIADSSPLIEELAWTLTRDTKDWYRAVFKLAEWVKDHIQHRSKHTPKYQYDADEEGVEYVVNHQPASLVLERRHGTSVELTALFVSLNRAVGIPARFVNGYSYHNKDDKETKQDDKEDWIQKSFQKDTDDDDKEAGEWLPHTWAEVFFPGTGWVPFDITGDTDENDDDGAWASLHCGNIMFGVSDDVVPMTTKGQNTRAISYRTRGQDYLLHPKPFCATMVPSKMTPLVRGHPKVEMSLQSHESNHKGDAGEEEGNSVMGLGSTVMVLATIENVNDFYVTTRFKLETDATLSIVDDNDTKNHGAQKEKDGYYKILLNPKEIRQVPFALQINKEAHSNLFKQWSNGEALHKFPIRLSSKVFGAEAEAAVVVEEIPKKVTARHRVRQQGTIHYSARDYHIRISTGNEDENMLKKKRIQSMKPTFGDFLAP